VARSPSPPAPRLVAIPADAGRGRIAEIVAAIDPDAVQFSGDESVEEVVAAGRPVWKALRVAARRDTPAAIVERARAYLDAGAERILLDAAGGPHPGGTGTRVDTTLAPAVPREVPVALPGGPDPTQDAAPPPAAPAPP